MNIHTARTLGQVESAIHAGDMDMDTAVHYMLAHCDVDADDLDEIRIKLRATVSELREQEKLKNI